MKLIFDSDSPCAVCGQKSTGWHFGAVTCRACAAFFRRSGSLKIVRGCKKGTDACQVVTSNGFFNCKKCRLQKCLDVGMIAESSNFDRNFREVKAVTIKQEVPPSVSTFLGRPNFIIFSSRSQLYDDRPKNFVDVNFLMRKAMIMLEKGLDGPIHAETSLEKLALGLRRVQSRYQITDIREMKKYGQGETLAQWEFQFLKLVEWLTYFDAFRSLPKCLQITMAKSIWNVWNRLLFLSELVSKVKSEFEENKLKRLERGSVVYDWSHVEFDVSWCSSLPLEQVQYFLDIPTQWKIDDLAMLMIELDPTDVELSYMLCQLSFYHLGKKKKGEFSGIAESFQESLANDLHKYYVEDMKTPCYAGRVTNMMKINNRIQQRIRENRSKIELAVVFDVVNCDVSHPEMFMDM